MFLTKVFTIVLLVIHTVLPQHFEHNFDITTLVKSGLEKTVVVARGNARGLPLRRDRSFLNATFAGHRCCQEWTREGWTKLDIETANEINPPLDPNPTGSFDGTTYQADRLDRDSTMFYGIRKGFWEWNSTANSAPLPVDGRLRLSFRLSNPTSTLQLYLCDAEELDVDEPEVECVAFFLSGFDSKRSILRYQALNLTVSESDTEQLPVIDTPFGKLQSTTLYNSETAPKTWTANITYNFLVERTFEGYFEVRLDGADLQQKRLMTIKATPKMNKFAAIATPTDSSTQLNVIPDRTWRGYIRPGGRMWVEFTTPENETGQELGVFLCADRFQEKCIGKVISGVSMDGFRFVDGNYSQNEKSDAKHWVAGSEEKTYHMTEIGRNETVEPRWEKIMKNRANIISITRYSNASVRINHLGLEDSKSPILNVPKEYRDIFIASNNNKSQVLAFGSNGWKCKGPAACIAPAPIWVLKGSKGELRSPSLPASVASRRVCVTIVAGISPKSRVKVALQQSEGAKQKYEMGTLSSESSPHEFKWLTKRFDIPTPKPLKNKTLEIVVRVEQPKHNLKPVMVQWVSLCNADGDEDVYQQNQNEELYSTEKGYHVLMHEPNTTTKTVCMNGGHMNLETNECHCAPGFAGGVCERGCGADLFGADCKGKCSRAFPGSRDCGGIKLCGPGLQCNCAPGFRGDRCTDKCASGRYGIGCRDTCGLCKDGLPCNPHTGSCDNGCRGPLQPPYCKEECGRTVVAAPYVKNGAKAKGEHFPWHAGVYESQNYDTRDPSEPEKFEQICGATLVKPLLLISAAHCFYNENEQVLKSHKYFKVALGKTYREWDDPKEKPASRVQRRNVSYIHIPENYRGEAGAYADDIALIELDEKVLTTQYVVPVCLDLTGGFEPVLNSNKTGTVVGWGKTEESTVSSQLKVAQIPFVESKDCLEQIQEGGFAKYITKDKFCAGSFDGDTVGSGDSGGGLVFLNYNVEGAWFLRGIVSVAQKFETSSYAVYTNVSSSRDWLTQLKNRKELEIAALAALDINSE